jgi:hypothetical protein
MLLLVFSGMDSDLSYTSTLHIEGYTDIQACEKQLNAMKRSLPDNVYVETAQCTEVYK